MITDREFNDMVGKIRFAQSEGDLAEVYKLLAEINEAGTPEMIANGYFISGRIKRDQGLLLEARDEWFQGVQHSPDGTYILFILCRYIGDSYKKDQARDEALTWYRKALLTCAEGEAFSGRWALVPFLELNGGTIPEEDRDIVARALEKTWRVHEFPREPDLDDLPGAIRELKERYDDLVERTIDESMKDMD